ncbi:ATP-binding protein [Peredibacter sp. HCB2-198]|uniref:GAF domain-containing sensor histidine kinase n=1 Tax=Peredibacter sp. HCB2-198 TaxID=3383025 RepID=UPI0038B60D8A
MNSNNDSEILNLLRDISKTDQTVLGYDYLTTVTGKIGEALGVEYVLVGRSTDENLYRIKTDVAWSRTKGIIPNFEYDLSGSPCEYVITGNRVCVHTEDVAASYPDDPLLAEMGIHGYVGAPIIKKDKGLTGLIVAMDTKVISDQEKDRIAAILEFFGSRIALEYFRVDAEEKLKQLNEMLESEIQVRTIKLVEAERELRNQEKLANLGMVTMGVAHELKNPFNLIHGSSEIIQNTIEKYFAETKSIDKHTGNAFEKIKKASELLSKQILIANQSLDTLLKQARTGELHTHNMSYDLPEVVDYCLNNSLHRFEEYDFITSIEFVKNYDSIFVKLASLEAFEKALEIFFDNSLYALLEKKQKSPPGYVPQLSVTTHSYEDHPTLIIRDNGVGIPEDIRHRLGRPFVSSKPRGRSTGLGIYLASIFVEKNCGTLTFDSVHGEYTEIKMVLK